MLSVAAGLALSSTALAQYSLSTAIPGTFTDISTTGTFLGGGDDASFPTTVSAAVANAFFTAGTLNVCTNGHCGYAVDTQYTNAPVPTASFYAGNKAFAAFWDDLITNVGGAGVYAQTIGSTLIIQWNAMDHYSSSPSTGTLQLQIFGGGTGPSGALAQVIYQDVDFGDANNNGASATIGFQTNGTTGIQFSFNTASVQNGTVLSLLASNDPGACCLPNGTCSFVSAANCTTAGGTFTSAGTTCAQANCPTTGRCCTFQGVCSVVLSTACTGTFTAGGTCASACPSIPGTVYSNCNLSTGPTTLNGVAAPANSFWSECARDETDPTTANTTAGNAGSGAFRLADDFVVPAGGMNLGFVKFPVYTTGATTVTTTAATIQIWNGPPGTGSVVFGDTTTNRLANAEFSNLYRTFNTVTPPACGGALTAPGTTRRIQWAYLAVNQTLPAGTYWIDVGYTGGTFTPLATQADAIGRQCNPNNANAMQFNAVWGPVTDAGQGCAPTAVTQDIYFELLGTGGQSCYPNCDNSTVAPILNVGDFTCFLQRFAAGDSYANCDNSTTPPVLNVGDFTCFLQRFAAGCP
jgi:hypothetical protein